MRSGSAEGVTARTVNKETVAFYQVLKLANDRGLISSLPHVRQLKQKHRPSVPCFLLTMLNRSCATARWTQPRTPNCLKFYLRFLALTGAREKEALRIRWADVDFEKRLVTIGADADTKSGRHRNLNFTPELRSTAPEMSTLPSARFARSYSPRPSAARRTFLPKVCVNPSSSSAARPKCLGLAFTNSGISSPVNASWPGVDFMTIASWLGHQDGGVLVGKVYGHLADEHKRHMADNLSILKTPKNVVEISAG